MALEEQIHNEGVLPIALEAADFPWLGAKYTGKVRDTYSYDGKKVLVATDRLSAFDRILTSVPVKGQVLTQIAAYWFDRIGDIAEHHVLAVPDPCVMVGREVQIVPIEVVVRGYLAGGGWRDYAAGRPISGHRLPPGLTEFSKLSAPIVTPSTKEMIGAHDLPISEIEIIEQGIVSRAIWHEIREKALALFDRASSELASRGLLFVDTKYEFGILDGRVVLADEIHTLDSSRFWMADSYGTHLERGEAPVMLDKEPIRRWLLDRGFAGEGDPPNITDEYRRELMNHYTESFRLITGRSFEPDLSPPLERIERNLRVYFGENR